MNTADILSIVSLALFGLSALLLITAAILFFTLKINSVIGFLTGRTARRSVEQMRESNEKQPVKGMKTNYAFSSVRRLSGGGEEAAARKGEGSEKTVGLNTEDIKREGSEKTTLMESAGEGSEKTTLLESAGEGSGETTLLEPAGEGSGETTLLEPAGEGSGETALLAEDEGENETSLLSGNAAVPQAAVRRSGVRIEPVENVMIIHTDEELQD